MESAVRFSPRSTPDSPRFLLVDVTGRSISAGRITAWQSTAPEANARLKYDLGPPTKKGVPPFRALDWAANRTHVDDDGESLVALGTPAGDACIVRVAQQHGHNVTATFPAKVQRLCNAVAFGDGNEASLTIASGLEKARHESCLLIWDLAQSSGTGPEPTYTEPLRKFSAGEAVSSIKFLADSQVLLAGIKGIGIRSYDTRDPVDHAGAQFSSSCAYNIAINPLDERYFACGSGPQKDATVQIWDRRMSKSSTWSQETQSSPVIEFRDPFGTSDASVWSVRYCKTQSGLLGASSSNGALRVFDTQSYTDTVDLDVQSLYTRRIYRVDADLARNSPRDSRSPVVSFDWSNMVGPKGTPTLMLLRKDRSIDMHEMALPAPQVALSTDRLAIAKDTDATDDLFADHIKLLSPVEPATSSRVYHQAGLATDADPVPITKALQIMSLSRQRCLAGYSFDCQKNIGLVKDNRWLQDLWTWIEHAKNIASSGQMSTSGLDLSYVGVHQIWHYNSNFQQQSRRTTHRQHSNVHAIHGIAQSLKIPSALTADTQCLEIRQLCLHTLNYGPSVDILTPELDSLAADGHVIEAAAIAVFHGYFDLAHKLLQSHSTPAIDSLSLAIAGFAKGSTHASWSATIERLQHDLDDPYARGVLALVRRGEWHDVVYETRLPLKARLGTALLHLDDEQVSQFISAAAAEAVQKGDLDGIALTGLTDAAVPLFQHYISKTSDLQTAVLALSHSFPRFFSHPRVAQWQKAHRRHMGTWKLYRQRARFDSALTKLSTPHNGVPKIPVAPAQLTLRCPFCDGPLDQTTTRQSAATFQREGGAYISTEFGIHEGSIFSGSTPDNTTDVGATGAAAPRHGAKSAGGATPSGALSSGTVCPKCGRHMPRCAICMHWLGVPRMGLNSGSYQHRRAGGQAAKQRHGPPGLPTASSTGTNGSGTESPPQHKPDDINDTARSQPPLLNAASNITSASTATATSAATTTPPTRTNKLSRADVLDNLMNICLSCTHTTHRGHARDWFKLEETCPVATCGCKCMSIRL